MSSPSPAIVCTPAEAAAVSALRARVSDVTPLASRRWASDSALLRFVRARKLNLDAAETMYRAVIAWRQVRELAELGPSSIRHSVVWDTSGLCPSTSLIIQR